MIIADDDLSSQMLLAHFVQLLPEYRVAGEVSNGEELIELVMKEKPEIILVDISMPGLNGVEAAKACKEMFPSLQVIFTTGYDDFAVEAFTISAVDYIVKPIERIRLFIALEKAKLALELQKKVIKKPIFKVSNKLSIKSGNTFLYILVDDILYVEKEGRKSIIHTKNDRLETVEPLQEIEKRLTHSFYKTHRSYLVNLRKIVKIESYGETYMAKFLHTDKAAYISKLKINEVHKKMGSS